MLLQGIACPACGEQVKLSFTIADEEKTDWIFCGCGSVFHQKKIEKDHFDTAYIEKYRDYKALRERFEYVMRCYLPMVEEMTFGRRFLDVGFGLDFHLKNLTERGWVVEGIDLIENDFITGDFERHDFKDQTFDFIFMGRVLECFEDPLKAVYKARELLNENGVLMVISPDAELIYSGGMWDFGNWNFKEVGMIFSERQIKKVMDQMGFNVVMSRKDRGKRFVGWNMFHLIAQKRVLSGDQ